MSEIKDMYNSGYDTMFQGATSLKDVEIYIPKQKKGATAETLISDLFHSGSSHWLIDTENGSTIRRRIHIVNTDNETSDVTL